MRLAIKGFQAALKSDSLEIVQGKLPEMQKTIDKAVKRGIIKPNTGARKKSRLMRLLKDNKK